jgi:restriction system protein
MIESPNSNDWRQIQEGVCRILGEIGLRAEQNKTVATPRGQVELDVYAIDENSVDKISYVVECKNWKRRIPQSVVHSFTTVMHEVGANIGYIVSREALQPGAVRYLQNTNVRAFTYAQFQEHYFPAWFERYFVKGLGDAVDPLAQYIEPFNSARDRRLSGLPEIEQQRFHALLRRYLSFGTLMAFFEFPRYSSRFAYPLPPDIDLMKEKLNGSIDGLKLEAVYFRDLLHELLALISSILHEFDGVFGGRIFPPFEDR